MSRKYSPSASKDVENEMYKFNKGTLKSGKGGKGGPVRSREQAIAIGLSAARKEGKKFLSNVPLTSRQMNQAAQCLFVRSKHLLKESMETSWQRYLERKQQRDSLQATAPRMIV